MSEYMSSDEDYETRQQVVNERQQYWHGALHEQREGEKYVVKDESFSSGMYDHDPNATNLEYFDDEYESSQSAPPFDGNRTTLFRNIDLGSQVYFCINLIAF